MFPTIGRQGRCRCYHFDPVITPSLILSGASGGLTTGFAAAAPAATAGLTAGQASLLLTAGTSAVSMGTSAYAASQQNKAISAGMDAQARAAAIQQQQLASQTGQAQQERVREANQLAARIRVARGEAGVGLGGSTAAVLRQADFDAASDINTIGQNYLMSAQRVRSGADAGMIELENRTQNPILTAFLGGMQGLNTGLQIGHTIKTLRTQ